MSDGDTKLLRLAAFQEMAKAELLTEDSVALAFADRYRNELRFDHDRGKWYVWIGARWQLEGTCLAFSCARELVRELANRSDGGSVAYCHRGVRLGYVPKRQRWIADALDDGLSLIAVAMKVKVGWINRRRAKFVATRIVVLSEGGRR